MLFVASDNLIWLLGLVDNNQSPPAYVTSATVSAQVSTLDGTAIGSAVTMTYVAGSQTVSLPNGQTQTSADGNYKGDLPNTVALVDGTTYYLTVTATSGGAKRTFRGSFKAGYTTN